MKVIKTLGGFIMAFVSNVVIKSATLSIILIMLFASCGYCDDNTVRPFGPKVLGVQLGVPFNSVNEISEKWRQQNKFYFMLNSERVGQTSYLSVISLPFEAFGVNPYTPDFDALDFAKDFCKHYQVEGVPHGDAKSARVVTADYIIIFDAEKNNFTLEISDAMKNKWKMMHEDLKRQGLVPKQKPKFE